MAASIASVVALLRRTAASHGTDADLLRAYAERRDAAAFQQLVARHGPLVLGVCRRALRDVHAADDAFQATFLLLARRAAAVRRPAALAAWLFGAARRVCADARRSRARRRAAEARAPVRPPVADPAAELSARELLAALDDELARLSERERLPLLLVYWQGLTQAEAAKRLGLSQPALRGRLDRSRQRLAERLTRRGFGPSAVLVAPLTTVAVPRDLLAATVALAADPWSKALPAAVLALTASAVPVKLLAGTVLGIVLAATGLVALAGGGTGRSESESPPPVVHALVVPLDEQPNAPRVDHHGDPLPDGAILRLGTTRLRHARTYAVAFTADNKLVSFGADYTARTWDPTTGRQLTEQSFEKSPIDHHTWGAGLSPDARRLAVQLGDRLKVFEIGSGQELASVPLASQFEAAARFSPDGRHVAVVDWDGKGLAHRVQVFDIGTGICRELARGGFRNEPVFSRDGQRLALALGESGVVVWDLRAGRELMRFKQPDGALAWSVDFDLSGDVLAVLGPTNPPQYFQFVRVSTGQPPDGWTAPPVGGSGWAQFAPDGATILIGGNKGVLWFDPKAGKTTHTAEGPARLRPAFSPDGRLVASAGRNTLEVWDARTGRSVVPVGLGDGAAEVHGVAVSPDGQWLLTKDDEAGIIRVWGSDGRPKAVIRSNRSGGRYPVFSPNGRHLFGGAPNAIALVRWDFPGGAESARYIFAEPTADQVYIYNFGLSADGRRLAALTQTVNRNPAAGGWQRPNELATLTVWDAVTAKRVESREFTPAPWQMYGAFSPDLRWYFSGDQPLALTGGPDFRLELPAGWQSRQAAVSADSRLVAQVVEERLKQQVNGRDWYSVEARGIVVHEVATGKQVLILRTDFCGQIAFTPDGRGLVVTDRGGITRWDLATQKLIIRHKAPGPFVGYYGNAFASSLALSADGIRAVTGHIDTTALVWDLPSPPRRAGTLSGRELDAAWDDLFGSDAGKAYAAVWAMADAAGDAVPFLRDRLPPAAALPEEQVRTLIADLDSPRFATREEAEKELTRLIDLAAPGLRQALANNPSAEVRQRAEKLLKMLDLPVMNPELLRQLRAVAALEQAGTPEARQVLRRLADGVPDTRLTREAQASLERLRRPK